MPRNPSRPSAGSLRAYHAQVSSEHLFQTPHKHPTSHYTPASSPLKLKARGEGLTLASTAPSAIGELVLIPDDPGWTLEPLSLGRGLGSDSWVLMKINPLLQTQPSGKEATRAKSMKSWKFRLQEGGHTCPGNGMNSGLHSGLSLFLPCCHGDGRGGKEADGPFPFKDLAVCGHPCERCLRLGTRDQESRPTSSSLRWRTWANPPSLDLGNPGLPPPLRPRCMGSPSLPCSNLGLLTPSHTYSRPNS